MARSPTTWPASERVECPCQKSADGPPDQVLDTADQDSNIGSRSPVTSPHVPAAQEQPLVLPQLGQAWHEPARCIWTPQVMQYGASECVTAATGTGASSSADRVDADGIDGGSGTTSWPVLVSMT